MKLYNYENNKNLFVNEKNKTLIQTNFLIQIPIETDCCAVDELNLNKILGYISIE